jgi:hypothetical protein
MERWTDLMRLTVTFHNIANISNKTNISFSEYILYILYCEKYHNIVSQRILMMIVAARIPNSCNFVPELVFHITT